MNNEVLFYVNKTSLTISFLSQSMWMLHACVQIDLCFFSLGKKC